MFRTSSGEVKVMDRFQDSQDSESKSLSIWHDKALVHFLGGIWGRGRDFFKNHNPLWFFTLPRAAGCV